MIWFNDMQQEFVSMNEDLIDELSDSSSEAADASGGSKAGKGGKGGSTASSSSGKGGAGAYASWVPSTPPRQHVPQRHGPYGRQQAQPKGTVQVAWQLDHDV